MIKPMTRWISSSLILVLIMVALGVGCGSPSTPDDSGDCDTSADIVMRGSDGLLGPGSYQITGSVTLATAAASGTYVQLSVDRTSLNASSELTSSSLAGVRSVVTYVVCNLPAGDYLVRLRTDRNGNLSYADPGDEDGYFNGTHLSPIQTSGAAAQVTITFGDASAGFGIAP